MAILVDYSCGGCGAAHEVWVEHPVPARRPCPVCGTATRRRFGGALLRGAAAPSAASAPKSPAEASLCQRYPAVPGLCHMNPVAARSWIARARKDNRALEREIARQEKAISEGALDASTSPITHGHGHGHVHGHSHKEGTSHRPVTSTDQAVAASAQQPSSASA